MAEPKGRRGGKLGGGGGLPLGAILGATAGGGGENSDYAKAAAEVKGGTLSSPGKDYDPRAATSAKGVLTPSMQKAYDTGPYKPLNWLGRLAGRPDPNTSFQLARAGQQEGEAARMESLPKELKIRGDAALEASNAAADAGDIRLAKALLKYREQQDTMEPGSMHHTFSPEEYRFQLGSQAETMGIPRALEMATGATARLPGTAESEVLGQQRTNEGNRLGLAQDRQRHDFIIDPKHGGLMDNYYKSGYLTPALSADSHVLANAQSLAERPWWGVRDVPGNRIMMSGPTAGGVMGETQAGQLGGKNEIMTDPVTGKPMIGKTQTIPPAFVSGVRSPSGGGTFMPPAPVMTPLLMPSGTDYGAVSGLAPKNPPTAAYVEPQALDKGEDFIETDPDKAPAGSWLENYRKQQEEERLKATLAPRRSRSQIY